MTSRREPRSRAARHSDEPRGRNHKSEAVRSSVQELRVERQEATNRLYGLNPILAALRAGRRQVEEIVIAEGVRDHRFGELVELARGLQIPVRRAKRAEFSRLMPDVSHQGVFARVAAARYADSSTLVEKLVADVKSGQAPLSVILDGVEDPGNLGAILRTVDCAGGDGVFIPERRSVGLTEVAAKASAGAIENVPVARVANISRLIDDLKAGGIWVVGTAADATTEYTEWDWTQPSALVLGNEGKGMHRLVREHCDVLVKIPLAGRTESLNVSVAAGVILFEALRQRRRAAASNGQVEQASETGRTG
jgi:23S rRNA (guanosine2251-2'-O)-methyltransferase